MSRLALPGDVATVTITIPQQGPLRIDAPQLQAGDLLMVLEKAKLQLVTQVNFGPRPAAANGALQA